MANWNPTRFTDVGLAALVIIALFNILRDVTNLPLTVDVIVAVIVWVFGSIILHRIIYTIQN